MTTDGQASDKSQVVAAAAKVKHHVRPLAEIVRARDPNRRAAYIVEGIIAEKSVNIAVGDSGIGKSPLAYQMGLCVAAGIPFLGRQVKPGAVLYLDLENGEDQFIDIAQALVRHLKLPEIPAGLVVLTEREDCPLLEIVIAEFLPVLVIIDSLRSYSPKAEEKTGDSAEHINRLRTLARKYGTSFLLIHHIRKTSDSVSSVPLVENSRVLDWLMEACGSRALINQTDTRIAFGPCHVPAQTKEKDNSHEIALRESVGLVMRWFERSRGESAPLFLSRELEESGLPVGYQPLSGPDLLFNEQMKQAWLNLPRGREFTFAEAKQTYGKQPPATKNWLEKCIAARIVTQAGKGLPYRVVDGVG